MEESFDLPAEAFEMRRAHSLAPKGYDPGAPPDDLVKPTTSPFDMPGYTPEKKRPEKVKPGSEMYAWVMEKVAIESSELLDPEKAEDEKDKKLRNAMIGELRDVMATHWDCLDWPGKQFSAVIGVFHEIRLK